MLVAGGRPSASRQEATDVSSPLLSFVLFFFFVSVPSSSGGGVVNPVIGEHQRQ
jgi:hypothetical protein